MAEENETGAAQSDNAGGQDASGQDNAGAGGSDNAGIEDILTGKEGDTGAEGEGGQGGTSGQDADDKGGDESNDDAGAPETYADFKLPEGMEADTGLIEAISPIFKELNLSQEKAQKLLDAYNGVVAERSKTQADEFKSTVEGWTKAIKDDKDYGGTKFAETAKLANKAVAAFDKGDLVGLLKRTGLCNHPEIIKAFAEAGKLISEDAGILPNGDGGQPKSKADIIYGGGS